MNVNLLPYFVLWLVLAVTVIGMIVWRKTVTSHEDEALHLDAGAVSQQVSVAHKIEVIDKWGKILTAITVLFGLALGAVYLYQSWVAMSRIGV